MKYLPKPIHEQVIVVTGATSGIGPMLVRTAANLKAKVFMIDKDEISLQKLQTELAHKKVESAFAVVDLTEKEQVQFATDLCLKRFHQIDCWINNPRPLMGRKSIDENFIGLTNASRIAVLNLKSTNGNLINLVPPGQKAFQSAINRFTNNLKRNVRKNRLSLSISLVEPADTIAVGDILERVVRREKLTWLQSINFKAAFKSGLLASGIGVLVLKGLKRL